MSDLQDLPRHVVRMIESGVVAEFATMTAKGVPIDRGWSRGAGDRYPGICPDAPITGIIAEHGNRMS